MPVREIGIIVVDDSVPIISRILHDCFDVSPECIASLFNAQPTGEDALWDAPEDVFRDGILSFCDVDGITRDWIGQYPELLKVLLEHKVDGVARFVDVDPELKLWGYVFDGQGDYTKLDGTVNWQRV
jgi:hypothetical protein